jgi:enolase-phosphatase E1
MKMNGIKCILTDIEGTTTSVSFVYDTLFPYFRENIAELKNLTQNPDVQAAFRKTVELSKQLEGKTLRSVDEIITTLDRWSMEDKKITPLKTVQGILWKKGYESGEIKGHVYADVPSELKIWKTKGLSLAVFSSGSVTAQKLIFGYSEAGDLTPYFSHYFDTETGGKREYETYAKIASELLFSANEILFLSDIKEELEAAKAAGLQTVQLVRPGTVACWEKTISDFSELQIN